MLEKVFEGGLVDGFVFLSDDGNQATFTRLENRGHRAGTTHGNRHLHHGEENRVPQRQHQGLGWNLEIGSRLAHESPLNSFVELLGLEYGFGSLRVKTRSELIK